MRLAIVFAALLATCAAAQTSIPLPKGFRPTALASADFNGDGHADIAVAGLGRGEVIVLLADGRGGLHATPPVAAGANPAGIDATKALIAIANHETDYVTLLSGNGKGGFTPRTLHLHSKPHPHAAAAGDFDRDGRHDLAVDSAGEKRIMLLFGRDGWRGPGTPIDLGTNPYWTISAADMDGDGNVDLVTPNGDYSARIAAGDINGDGFADAVFANSNGATVTIVYGSRGGPRKTASVPVMPHPHAVTIAGRDIIVATEDEDRLLVVRGR